jgi:hypothetical protein
MTQKKHANTFNHIAHTKPSLVILRASVWLVGLAFLTLINGTEAAAQDTPRIQVFAGYTRLQFDSKTIGFSDKTGLNGWTGAAAFNLTPEFGIVGEVGEQFGPNLRSRNWLIGPQFVYGKWHTLLFAHALFGKADTRISTSSISETQNGKAMAFGGGFDFPISSRFSIRVIQADYFRTHSFAADQANAMFSTGLVFNWGAISKKRKNKL